MSGDVIVLRGEGLEPLGRALVRLCAAAEDLVLVGGLGTMLRIGGHHRATVDLDVVGSAADIITTATRRPGITRIDRSHLDIDGVPVDLIDIDADADFVDTADPGLHLADRTFLTAHLWALRSHSPVNVDIAGHTTTVAVATHDALLGGKLSARLDPRRNPAKRRSDAADIVRLLALDHTDRHRPTEVSTVLAEALDHVAEDAAALAADASAFDPSRRPVTGVDLARRMRRISQTLRPA